MPNTISHRSTLLARRRIVLNSQLALVQALCKWPNDARTFKSVTRNGLFGFSVGYFGAWDIPRILNEPETCYFKSEKLAGNVWPVTEARGLEEPTLPFPFHRRFSLTFENVSGQRSSLDILSPG